ncbi:MAG: YgiQ family radical SAM protein [Bacteroidetes bacterium GWF2_40_14]|nr:MAG: YgiQ family radical SAM protein [Bacteroidetes bacterium GWF2_40_14]
MENKPNQFIPTSKKEVEALGWDYLDIILFSGDAYIDHPSFGTAVIARILEREGYRVAIVPQPNWRDDLRDFKKLGVPRLFFGVNAGVMDSMVNHYTANKRLRSNDAYTPDGKASQRPDYAVKVYTKILKELYPDVPVVIGGIEASLRRLTHYDYWHDSLMPSILVDSEADILVYGMGEKPIVEIAGLLAQGASLEEVKMTPQIAYIADYEDNGIKDRILLHSYETCLKKKMAFVENFNIIERESNSYIARHLIEPYKDRFIHINRSNVLPSVQEIDSYYDLPFTKLPHPRYKGKHIPAYEMIKFSINTHRGCFGSCSFCTISAHQGKLVQSRSMQSIIKEITGLTQMAGFKGYISDVGGPTANMFAMSGNDMELCKKCKKDSCIYPNICPNLNRSHDQLLELYNEIDKIPGVRKSFIGSGIRYDLFLNENGYLDESGRTYLREIIVNHTSGRLKVAPEHTEEHVLKVMGKPSFRSFIFLKEEFERINKNEGLKLQLVPYFISSHPGCKISDMKSLSQNSGLKGINLEQVQDFTPTPMTRSSVAFYTGIDTKTLKNIFVETDPSGKQKQKQFFFNKM